MVLLIRVVVGGAWAEGVMLMGLVDEGVDEGAGGRADEVAGADGRVSGSEDGVGGTPEAEA